MKVDIIVKSIPSFYCGFVNLNDTLFDVFQLRFWSDEDCAMSGVERQRERSEERR